MSCQKKNQNNENSDWNKPEVNLIKIFIETDFPPVIKDYILHIDDLNEIYSRNNYNFLWFDSISMTAESDTAIYHLQNAHRKGLDSSFYKLNELKNQIHVYNKSKSFLKKSTKVIIDLLLTDSYLNYCYHLAYGWSDKANQSKIKFDLVELFSMETPSIIQSKIENQNVHYQNFIHSWDRFADNFIGFDELNIPFFADDSLKCYASTVDRLIFFKLLEEKDTSHTINIRNALIQYQYLFGLESTGKPDSLTVLSLRKGFDYYQEQAMLTIEKLKNASFDTINSFILINIPTYSLFWVEENVVAKTHRVVSGSVKHQTPELESSITKYTIFPDWNLPYSIATKETLPSIKRNVNYLQKNKYIITNHNRELVDPQTVNWSKLNRTNFPYRIVQTPGEHNALGLIKFFFHNSHDVYLHDTPQKRFFKKNIRALSHGCMRLENPFDFLKTILEYQEGMLHYHEDLLNEKQLVFSQKKFEKIRDGKENIAQVDTFNAYVERRQQIDFRFKKKIPLFVHYYCSFYDFEGNILFYPDVYSRDEELAQELRLLRSTYKKD